MQGFELQYIEGSNARYKFTCCQNNADVLDTHNSERGDKQIVTEAKAVKKLSYGYSATWHGDPNIQFNMKDHFKDHAFSCRLQHDQEILRSFVYTEDKEKRKKNLFADEERYTFGAYDFTCARLKQDFSASCEDMETKWTDKGFSLSRLNGLQVDCRKGLQQSNGERLNDGERRFLNHIKVEKQGSKFRYKFNCCRINQV